MGNLKGDEFVKDGVHSLDILFRALLLAEKRLREVHIGGFFRSDERQEELGRDHPPFRTPFVEVDREDLDHNTLSDALAFARRHSTERCPFILSRLRVLGYEFM